MLNDHTIDNKVKLHLSIFHLYSIIEAKIEVSHSDEIIKNFFNKC